MTSRERLLAAYAHKAVDCVPCSPRIWAWLLEYYGNAGIQTFLRAAAEFDFDIHLSVGVFSHPYELHARGPYELPGVVARQEEWQDGDYRVIRRIFRTPAGELTDVTRFPPRDPAYGIAPDPIRSEHLVKSRDDLPRLSYLIVDKNRADYSSFFAIERELGERGLLLFEMKSALCHRAGVSTPWKS